MGNEAEADKLDPGNTINHEVTSNPHTSSVVVLPIPGIENQPESSFDEGDDPASILPESAAAEVTLLTLPMLSLGGHYDVMDSCSRWCEGEVVKIDSIEQRVFISYLYWDSKFDEWISNISGRIAPLHTHTYKGDDNTGADLKVGQRIEVLDERNIWLEAFVISASQLEVVIHYKGYHSNFDERLPRISAANRVRPYGRNKQIEHKRNYQHRTISSSSDSSSDIGGNCAGIKRWRVPNTHYTDRSPSLWAQPGIKASSREEADPLVSSIGGRGILEEESSDLRQRRISELSAQYHNYIDALEEQGLAVVQVRGDGNCLFRTVAHQIYGDEELHNLVRQKCVDYMEVEAEFFSQFVEGGLHAFPLYLQAKRRDACWGDDPEIEAICELYNRPAEIWAYEAGQGARKLRTFHETSTMCGIRSHLDRRNSHGIDNNGSGDYAAVVMSTEGGNRLSEHDSDDPADESPQPMRLSYYGGGHYDSIVRVHELQDQNMQFNDPPHSQHNNSREYQQQHSRENRNLRFARRLFQPGELEDHNIALTKHRHSTSTAASRRRQQQSTSNSIAGDTQILQEARRISDREATEQAALDAVLLESRRMHMDAAYEDLETSLLLSLEAGARKEEGSESLTMSMVPTMLGADRQSESKASIEPKGGAAMVASSDDPTVGELADLQRDMLRSVQKQSEEEYIEAALISSLPADCDQSTQNAAIPGDVNAHLWSDDGNDAADILLQQQLQQARKESEELELLRQMGEIAAAGEDESFQLALQMSRTAHDGRIAAQNNGTQFEDDAELQRALEASLATHTQPQYAPTSLRFGTQSSSSSSVPRLPHTSSVTSDSLAASVWAGASPSSLPTAAASATDSSNAPVAAFDMEELDEDLLRAIEESLKKS